MTHTDLEKLNLSGSIRFGSRWAVGKLVWHCAVTEDGRHFVFDANGKRVGDFATQQHVEAFISVRARRGEKGEGP